MILLVIAWRFCAGPIDSRCLAITSSAAILSTVAERLDSEIGAKARPTTRRPRTSDPNSVLIALRVESNAKEKQRDTKNSMPRRPRLHAQLKLQLQSELDHPRCFSGLHNCLRRRRR